MSDKILVEISNLDFITKVNDLFQMYNIKYMVKEIKIEDDFFKEDPIHKQLKEKANKAYKQLKEYEYIKRNK